LHWFAPEQPDFNWENREVQKDFLKTLKFWSDRGVDGFRIDVAHGLAKDLSEPLRSMPVHEGLEQRGNKGKGIWGDRNEVFAIYKEWRKLFNQDDPPRVAVAEAYVHPERLPLYASTKTLGQCFDFRFIETPFEAHAYKTATKEAIELAQKNVFEGRSFNPNEFNNLFEKNKRKEEKKLKKQREAGDMVVYEDQFTAFNDTGLGNFISVDQDYGDIYNDKQDFKDQSKFTKLNKINVDDISVSSDSDFEYSNDYSNYKNNKLTADELKRKMAERDLDTKKYDSMKFNEFKSVMEDQFGISKDFGTLIGEDISNTGKTKKLTSDMAKIYSRMIDYDSSDED